MNKHGVKFYHFIPLLSITLTLLITTIMFACWYSESNSRLNFEYIRSGLCVYAEYNRFQGQYSECLVYDNILKQVIEVSVNTELAHRTIEAGDTIIYFIDYNCTDGDFLNVIKGD